MRESGLRWEVIAAQLGASVNGVRDAYKRHAETLKESDGTDDSKESAGQEPGPP